MQKHSILIMVCILLFCSNSYAQNVTIPDSNFKTKLTTASCADLDGDGVFESKVDTNGDGEIQLTEAQAVKGLHLNHSGIHSLEGIAAFTNLEKLNLVMNMLTTLDLSANVKLTDLNCTTNALSTLDLSSLPLLTSLYCSENPLTQLNISQNVNLKTLSCGRNNNMTSLTVSHLSALTYLYCAQSKLTTLDVSQNAALTSLECFTNEISSLDVSQNTNLKRLYCSGNPLGTLDVSQNAALEEFKCSGNVLTQINTNNNTNLKLLDCSSNQISTLPLSHLLQLKKLDCSNNLLTTLNASFCEDLRYLSCINNQLQTIYYKHGAQITDTNLLYDDEYQNGFHFQNNPNLEYICVDEINFPFVQMKIDHFNLTNCIVGDYCTFAPGGVTYEVKGTNRWDLDNNGCSVSDPILPHLKFQISGPTSGGTYIGNHTGNYSLFVTGGTHTITPQFNQNYFTISPPSITVNFPTTNTSPLAQDFCAIPNGTHHDIEVSILPIDIARPGFDASYTINFQNKGNTTRSGSVTFNYDDNTLDYVSATLVPTAQNTGQLSWNYTNLQPFESRNITVTLNLNSPTETPPLNANDILNFTANITPVAQDETPNDNAFTLNQTVVNSYDPNDKTCLSGEWLDPVKVGDYVQYRIRFENKGTASAVNVVVKDIIDVNKFELASLKALYASHDFVTRIHQNKVEFIFENINLPFDDANNDGYIFFKIKTKANLQINDTFTNKASIYFDYNPAIVTNTATTTVGILSTPDYIIDESIALHPNPASNFLNIAADNSLKTVIIYDLNGRVLKQINPLGQQKNTQIKVADLARGIYLLKITSNKGQLIEKFVKK